MKKTAKLITLIITLLILIGILSFYLFQNYLIITGKAVVSEEEKQYNYTYTKAVCDETHCQDYLITCDGSELLESTPITGMVSHDADWEDPRDEKIIKGFCNVSS